MLWYVHASILVSACTHTHTQTHPNKDLSVFTTAEGITSKHPLMSPGVDEAWSKPHKRYSTGTWCHARLHFDILYEGRVWLPEEGRWKPRVGIHSSRREASRGDPPPLSQAGPSPWGRHAGFSAQDAVGLLTTHFNSAFRDLPIQFTLEESPLENSQDLKTILGRKQPPDIELGQLTFEESRDSQKEPD